LASRRAGVIACFNQSHISVGNMNISFIVNGASVAFAITAAFLWLKASRIVIKQGGPLATGWMVIEGIDVMATAQQQGKWNSRAAIATGVSVILQAFASCIH
jgi:hypothetical protein